MRVYPRYLTAAALLAATAAAQADISYTQRISVEASGGMSMFSSDGTVVTEIAGDKARIENNFKMKSRLAGAFANQEGTGSIIRLDRGLNWNLNPEEQEYSEYSFAELRARREQAMSQMQGRDSESALPVSADGCQWSEGEVDFERSRSKEEVAGIDTKKTTVRMHQSCNDPETGNQCDITWSMETWLASKVPAEKEARAFREGWAEALGITESRASLEGPANSLLAMFASNWDEVAEELEQMRGYPLRTVMQMSIGGEQCKTASGMAIAMDDMWTDASTAAYNAALDETGNAAGEAVGTAAEESLGEGIAGSIGGAAIGAATGEIIGGLTGMFRKSKDEPPPQASADQAKVTVFTITSEVTDWSESNIPQARFAEPTDWTKVR